MVIFATFALMSCGSGSTTTETTDSTAVEVDTTTSVVDSSIVATPTDGSTVEQQVN